MDSRSTDSKPKAEKVNLAATRCIPMSGSMIRTRLAVEEASGRRENGCSTVPGLLPQGRVDADSIAG